MTENCEIRDCNCAILSRHRRDEGGRLCPTHFYALLEIEGSPLGHVDIPAGPYRRYFFSAVSVIAFVQRQEILEWRALNPAAQFEAYHHA